MFRTTEDEDSHVLVLKRDYHSMSFDEKIKHWTACAATRMNDIRNLDKSSKSIIDIWPPYKQPDGFRLVRNVNIKIY